MATKSKAAASAKAKPRDIDSGIIEALTKTNNGLRSLLSARAESADLNAFQAQVLLFMGANNPDQANINYITEEFQVPAYTVREAVKVLLRKKFLKKLSDPTDGRAIRFEVTAKGTSTIKSISNYAKPVAAALSKMNGVQKKQLLDGLDKLVAHLVASGILVR